MAWPSGARASCTCWASSRVGTRTRPRGARRPCLTSAPTRASSGRPKASVLPEPVAALPSTSRPARASGQGGGLDGERAVDAAPLEGGHQRLGQAQLTEGRAGRGLVRSPGWCRRCSERYRRSTRTRQGGPQSCGVGLRYSSERVPWKRKAPADAGVPTGDRLRPGVERGICTDALMPGQTVREDDRPMCRYAQVSSEDRSGDSRGRRWQPSPPSAEQRRVPRTDDVGEQALPVGVAGRKAARRARAR